MTSTPRKALRVTPKASSNMPRCNHAGNHPYRIRLPPLPRRNHSKNQPASDVRADLLRLTGVDIAAVVGIGPSVAQTILAEIGTDMSRWSTEKHFASWCGVASHNDISGSKVLRSRTLPTRNRAGQAFRPAATVVGHTASALGAF